MKKLLMLGGANSQVTAIKKAKELGYYVITCDYLPENPGHSFSDEYVNVSTTEKEAVLEIAIKKKIDGISAYASDPAAETAAYVAEKMKLNGTGFYATKILAEKDLFRNFQKENGFLFPKFICVQEEKEPSEIFALKYPCMVKPVDSSGSKGILKVENQSQLKSAIAFAMTYSRAKRVIIEEFIQSPYKQIHGEGFVKNGELVFVHLGEQNFYNMVPIGTSCPCCLEPALIRKAEEEVARLIKKVDFVSGAINIEVRIDNNDNIYILEIGPRSGGNYMPELIAASTGFDETLACIQFAMENNPEVIFEKKKEDLIFQYIIGSRKEGIFEGIWISDSIKDKVVQSFIHKKRGDKIQHYRNSTGVVGVLLFKVDTEEQLNELIAHVHDNVKVMVS